MSMHDKKKMRHDQVLARLYASFLRVAELPGQWHEGGPSFLTVCMIFSRRPLALLPSTVPS
ncbi:hypothetical protein ALC56_07557 [Trachymyrmex septentrionalis]|uniref:Uncharacterized protein n=1 Tax=Trachymyrmex septentrionalis TaxID=34720 RepID=A0A151JWD7_9HYME|nr:hypothetical protein ALC56_07557 [Trachymyrmex septentrionalis]